jgi:hypothetical protein
MPKKSDCRRLHKTSEMIGLHEYALNAMLPHTDASTIARSIKIGINRAFKSLPSG